MKILVTPATDTTAQVTRSPTLGEGAMGLYLARPQGWRRSNLDWKQPSPRAGQQEESQEPGQQLGRSSYRKCRSHHSQNKSDCLLDTGQFFGRVERPPPNLEPTVEQLSGLKALVEPGQAPNANFGLFQPFGGRHGACQFEWARPGQEPRSGAPARWEIFGPTDITVWRQCFDLWSNCVIMLDIIDLGPLQQYRSII